jgi:hypothetical protein
MANSNALQGTPRGLYWMKGLGGGKARVWITDGTIGAAIYEDQYRTKGFRPSFEYLPSKAKYDAERSRPNA